MRRRIGSESTLDIRLIYIEKATNHNLNPFDVPAEQAIIPTSVLSLKIIKSAFNEEKNNFAYRV